MYFFRIDQLEGIRVHVKSLELEIEDRGREICLFLVRPVIVLTMRLLLMFNSVKWVRRDIAAGRCVSLLLPIISSVKTSPT